MLLWQSMRHHCVPRTVSTGTWQESGHRWCDRWCGCLGGCRRHYGQEFNDSRTGAGHDNQRDWRSADESTTNDHHEELVERPSVALDPSWNSRPVLLAVALWRRTGSLHGWQEKEKEVEEGDARQPALSRACIAARHRGTAGVAAYGTPSVGAIPDYAGGCTDDGGDGSDGANCDAHNGRDCRSDDAAHNAGECCPDDADICAHSNFGYASDADGRARSFSDAHDGKCNDCSGHPSDSDAGDRWVWNASVASNGWRRLRNASAARNPLKRWWPHTNNAWQTNFCVSLKR